MSILIVYQKIITRLNYIKIKIFKYFLNIFNYIISSLYIKFYKKINLSKKNNSKIPIILLCRFKKHFVGSSDESMEKFHLVDSLVKRKIKLVSYYWDQKQNFFLYYVNFVKKIINTKPDLVILSSYSHLKKRYVSQPNLSIMNKLKNKFETSFVALWWDTCSHNFINNNILPLERIVDLNIINDNPRLQKEISIIKKPLAAKIICESPSYDPDGIFRPKKKDIDVSFLGQVSSYRDYRKDYIDFLLLNKVNGVFSTAERAEQKSHKYYAQTMGRSKIGINFSYSVDMHQLKGRVFETLLSGALLLEMKNDQTSQLFEEGVDYISFDGKKDLLNKINYYLRHEDLRKKIADNGRKKVLDRYNGQHYWDAIFPKVGINA